MTNNDDKEWRLIQSAIARLRASVMAVVFGMVGGSSIFLATAWLLAKGAEEGQEVGPNLSLLSQFLPGYSVTWGGAVLGLVYGAVLGAIVGGLLAWLYNMFASDSRAA